MSGVCFGNRRVTDIYPIISKPTGKNLSTPRSLSWDHERIDADALSEGYHCWGWRSMGEMRTLHPPAAVAMVIAWDSCSPVWNFLTLGMKAVNLTVDSYIFAIAMIIWAGDLLGSQNGVSKELRSKAYSLHVYILSHECKWETGTRQDGRPLEDTER